MNADRFYDTPHHDDPARDRAAAACIDDATSTGRDITVRALHTLAEHIAAGHPINLPAPREQAVEVALRAVDRHLDTLDNLPAHHDFDTPTAEVEERTADHTTTFLTVLTEAAHAYHTHIIGVFETTLDDATHLTDPHQHLPRTA